MMRVEDFGEVQTLISIFLLAGIALHVFGMIVVNIVTNSQEDHSKNLTLTQLYTFAFYIMSALALLLLLLSPVLMNILRFQSLYPFFALAVILPLSVPLAFQKAYLQGIHNFFTVSWANIIAAGGRLLFAIVLVSLGWATFGAIFALTIALSLTLLYTYSKTRRALSFSLKEKIVFDSAFTRELSYGLLIFSAIGFVTFLYTADVILVKFFFSPDIAGFYGGISTIARIIFYATGPIALVLLSHIKLQNTGKENHAIFVKAVSLVGFIGGLALIIFGSFRLSPYIYS